MPIFLAWELSQGLQTTKLDNAELWHVQLEAWKKVKRIRCGDDLGYIQSEGIQILALLKMWGSLGNNFISRELVSLILKSGINVV